MLLTRRTFKSLFLFLFLALRSMPSVTQSVTTFAKFAWSEGNNRRILNGISTYIIPLLNRPQILSPSRSSTTKLRESPGRGKQTPTPNSFTSCTNFLGGNFRIIMWRKFAKEFQRESHPRLEKFRALQLSLAHRFVHKHRATVRGRASPRSRLLCFANHGLVATKPGGF